MKTRLAREHRLRVSITDTALAEAPLCENCFDYVDEPECKLVWRKRGWVHAGTNSVRCAGQEDDDTDDRGEAWVIKGRFVITHDNGNISPVLGRRGTRHYPIEDAA